MRLAALPRQWHAGFTKPLDGFDLDIPKGIYLSLREVAELQANTNHRFAKAKVDGSEIEALIEITSVFADAICHACTSRPR